MIFELFIGFIQAYVLCADRYLYIPGYGSYGRSTFSTTPWALIMKLVESANN